LSLPGAVVGLSREIGATTRDTGDTCASLELDAESGSHDLESRIASGFLDSHRHRWRIDCCPTDDLPIAKAETPKPRLRSPD
jgi:hypothetical protein